MSMAVQFGIAGAEPAAMTAARTTTTITIIMTTRQRVGSG